jgi:pimeloyl-ACP methyl ester carboxylesterase
MHHSLAALFLALTTFAALAQESPADPGEAGRPAVDEAIIEPALAGLEPWSPGSDWEWLRDAQPDTLVCPFRDRIDYEPGEIECGLIRVPENREVAGSRTIELHYVLIKATGQDHEENDVEIRPDPVIYLTGGPGVTVEVYVSRLKDHRLVAQRDLYILEQRGIGNSGDFCPFFDSRNRADQIHADRESSERAMLEQADVCIDGARAQGVDVTGYNTFENARDLKALRLALGLDEWNVWGISYGSVLGQAYMKVDPEGIRSAVIDAIVPLDIGELMRLPYWHDANLARLFEACAAQADCARVYPGLAERYLAAIQAVNDSPISVEVEPSEVFPQGQAHFFADLIAGLPFSLMYEQKTHPALPAIIDGLTRVVESGDDTLFRALAVMASEGGDGMDIEVSMGMSVAVRCMDGYVDGHARVSPEDFRLFPELAHAFGHPDVILETPERCRAIGLAARDPAQFAPVQTDLPVVVVNGRWDPVTPVALAEYIMPGFENGQLVIFPHAGHGPTRSIECAGDWLNTWFDDPSASVDRQCVDQGEEAAEFIAPYFRSSAVIDALAMKGENETRLKAHGIWAGVSAGITLLAMLILPLAWVGRRLNGHRLKGAGGSRLAVFFAALLAMAWLTGLGLAAWQTSKITEAMLLFGLVSWATWFAWLGPLSVMIAVLALFRVWRRRHDIPPASRIGLLLAALAVVSLGVAGQVWSLWPF